MGRWYLINSWGYWTPIYLKPNQSQPKNENFYEKIKCLEYPKIGCGCPNLRGGGEGGRIKPVGTKSQVWQRKNLSASPEITVKTYQSAPTFFGNAILFYRVHLFALWSVDFQLCSHCPDCPAWWESVSVICAPYPPPHSAANSPPIPTHPPQHFNWQKHFSLGHIFTEQPTLHSGSSLLQST